jgi:hypothetical protein
MTRTVDSVIAVAACLAAFAVGVVGVSVYAWWDVSRRMI